MAVDENPDHPVDQGITPTPSHKRRWYEEDPDRPEDPAPQVEKENPADVTVELDELANAKMLARILTVSDKTPSGERTMTHRDPLEKYTASPMPEIHDQDPATLLVRIDQLQVQYWLSLPTGKVLARPFGNDISYKPNHEHIAIDLSAAVKEITGALKVAVAPPNKDPDISRWEKCPITFLIHSISKEDERTLLERKVWSSNEITFQVASINIKRPDFLFTMKGFVTKEPKDVLTSLAETWEDPVTTRLIRKLASDAPTEEEQQEWYEQMIDFLESAVVQPLDIRSQGGKEDPHFNVYANSNLVVCRLGLQAGSQTKTDVGSRSGTGPRMRPGKAPGPVSKFGIRLPRAHVLGRNQTLAMS